MPGKRSAVNPASVSWNRRRSQMTMFSLRTPAATRPPMTASTTSGLVERSFSPMGLTLMPTTSLGPTNCRQALPGFFSPVSSAIPASSSRRTRSPSIFCPTGLAPVLTLTTRPGYFPGIDPSTRGIERTSSMLVLMSGGAAGTFRSSGLSWPIRRGAMAAPAAATAAEPKNLRRENLSEGQASLSPVRVTMSSLRMGASWRAIGESIGEGGGKGNGVR